MSEPAGEHVAPEPATVVVRLTPDAVAARLRAAGCVWAEEEAALLLAEGRSAAETERMIARRAAGEPLEIVVGWAEFCGLRIATSPGVFVPRRRTEALAEEARRRLPPGHAIAVDLCCGAGAIGAVLLARRPELELHATDLDARAVETATRNLSGAASVSQGDLFEALPDGIRGRIALVAANVPYVPSSRVRTLPAEAREHEPLVALDGGADGLAILRRALDQAAGWLAPGGVILSETDADQALAAAHAARHAGLDPVTVVDDEREVSVLVATRPL